MITLGKVHNELGSVSIIHGLTGYIIKIPHKPALFGLSQEAADTILELCRMAGYHVSSTTQNARDFTLDD